MSAEALIALAYCLDLLCGDPAWFPHPVRYIGRGALALEVPLRRHISNQRLAGVTAVLIIVGGTAATAVMALSLAYRIHPWLGDAVSILILYTVFATRDLANHAFPVYRALQAHDLPTARRLVARIVGRDTAVLDEPGIIRAAVESVAENTVDGITAPLFFAALGGPVAGLTYKAISTLDSTFGYKNERYLHFGWAAARLDDAAAWAPARLTLPIFAIASAISGGRPLSAWRLGLRDGRKHASPNSGFAEASVAGALGVQLGGPLFRQGRRVDLPSIGEPIESLSPKHIRHAIVLMLLTSFFTAAFFLACRLAVEKVLQR